MTRFKKLKEKIETRPHRSDITYSELQKYLNHYGHYLERVNGSHYSYVNFERNRITFPVHNNKIKSKYVQLITECMKQEDFYE